MEKNRYRAFLTFDFALAFTITLLFLPLSLSYLEYSTGKAKEHAGSLSLSRKVSDAADYLIKAGLAQETPLRTDSNILSEEKLLRKQEILQGLKVRLSLSNLQIYLPPDSLPSPAKKERACATRLAVLSGEPQTLLICGEQE